MDRLRTNSRLEALAESRRTTRMSSLQLSYPSSSNETGGSGSVPTGVSGTTARSPRYDVQDVHKLPTLRMCDGQYEIMVLTNRLPGVALEYRTNLIFRAGWAPLPGIFPEPDGASRGDPLRACRSSHPLPPRHGAGPVGLSCPGTRREGSSACQIPGFPILINGACGG